MTIETQQAPSPYEFLRQVPSLAVTSDDIADGEDIPSTHVYNQMGASGDNLSPHLRWDGHPSETKSFAVSCFDPDAPTGSGFWHWVVRDIPADVTELPRGAGSGTMDGLPAGAVPSRNDLGTKEYIGAAPPEGPAHRYLFAVHALDCESLGLDPEATPAIVGFHVAAHVLARGIIAPVYGR